MFNTLVASSSPDTEATSSGIGALGLNWKAFIFQLITFAIVVWFLNKFVVKNLFKVIDARQKEIEAGLERSKKASLKLENAGANAEKILKEARAQAEDLIHTANNEAASLIKAVEEKAAKKSERIVSDARAQLNVEVEKARIALKKENAKLIAQATEKVISEKMDSAKDQQLISEALK